MQTITSESDLEALYGTPKPLAIQKVASTITPRYRQWIEVSRFLVLASVGPEGTDLSPRGDIGPVSRIQNNKTILIPDWLGNNRMDSLRNIVRDSRVSLMYMVPGSNNVVRVNGHAVLTMDGDIIDSFAKKNLRPKSVVVITVNELYFQCAKALMRSQLWTAQGQGDKVPTAGEFLQEAQSGFDAAGYDEGYPEYARDRMW